MDWKGYLKTLIEIEKDGNVYYPKNKDKIRKLKEILKDKEKFIEYYKKMVFGGMDKKSFEKLLEKERKEDIDSQIYFHPEIPREVYEKQAKNKFDLAKKDYEELLKCDWEKIKERL